MNSIMLAIEQSWITINNFLTDMPTTFLAIIFALFVEKIANELSSKGLKFPIKEQPNLLTRMTNLLLRLMLAFIISYIFFYIIFIIIAVISAGIGFSIQA